MGDHRCLGVWAAARLLSGKLGIQGGGRRVDRPRQRLRREIDHLSARRRSTAVLRALKVDLMSYYRAAGFAVVHVPARDHQTPPLSLDQLKAIWNAYRDLPKPVLVHCSAGIDRTGRAVVHLQQRLIENTD
jgi:Tyrosine phosphatase family